MKINKELQLRKDCAFVLDDTNKLTAKNMIAELAITSDIMKNFYNSELIKKFDSTIDDLITKRLISYSSYFDFTAITINFTEAFLQFIIESPHIKVTIE